MLLQIYYMEKYIFPYYPNISPLVFGVSPYFLLESVCKSVCKKRKTPPQVLVEGFFEVRSERHKF